MVVKIADITNPAIRFCKPSIIAHVAESTFKKPNIEQLFIGKIPEHLKTTNIKGLFYYTTLYFIQYANINHLERELKLHLSNQQFQSTQPCYANIFTTILPHKRECRGHRWHSNCHRLADQSRSQWNYRTPVDKKYKITLDFILWC